MTHEALFKIGYGLYVLSARQGNKDNACINNTFLQITSNDPVVCVIAVNKRNLTHEMILATGQFNVSVLTTKALFAVYERFGFQSGKDTDKFKGLSGVSRSKNGLVYLTENTNAFLSFTVKNTADYGTHTLFTAEITESGIINSDESVTYGYYHANIKPKLKDIKSKGYRCTICGYVYDGDPLPDDFICPICKHSVNDFVKI